MREIKKDDDDSNVFQSTYIGGEYHNDENGFRGEEDVTKMMDDKKMMNIKKWWTMSRSRTKSISSTKKDFF